MINFDPIEKNLFIGSAPVNEIDVDRLKKMRVTAVVSLQSDNDFVIHNINWPRLTATYQQAGIEVQRFGIEDFNEADLLDKADQPIVALARLLGVGHSVYVHCNAGICRAPATVIGYLSVYRDMSPEQALKYVRQSRPQVNPYMRAVNEAVAKLKSD